MDFTPVSGGVPEWLTRRFGSRYRLEGELGQGATATVYRALDPKRRRTVALKVLRPDLSAAIGKERFLREIEIAARLQHPNILPLFDSGEIDDVLFYTMPLVEGPSLQELLAREGALPIEEVIRISSDVTDALAYAHRHDVVHRDVKPGNVLLTSGRAVVSDFGIARALSEAGGEKLTQSGVVVGTPAYMSPEQAGGEQLDERSDLYSLGCLMFEMLTGEPPFSGRTFQALLTKHALQPAPRVGTLRPDTPAGLESIVEELLAKVAADRPRPASLVAERIRRSSLTGPRHRIWRVFHAARNRRVAAFVAFAVVAGLLLWQMTGPRAAANIDEYVVLTFPLIDQTSGAAEGPDLEAAALIGAVLETDSVVTARDGWAWLTDRERAGFQLLSPGTLRATARRVGAGRAVLGSIRAGSETRLTAVLELHDAIGDSLLTRVEVDGPPGEQSGPEAILRASARLVPEITGRARDLSISSRNPEAVAYYARGITRYRSSRFDAALADFLEAVAIDSTFALAAVGGALATTWLHDPPRADSLAQLAFRHGATLSPKYRALGQAVVHYWDGMADSALVATARALDVDSTWAIAHALEGEVYYHLMPSAGPLDSLAEVALTRARVLDPGLSPPLFHLAEINIRRGELTTADSLVRLFAGFDPDPTYPRRLGLMIDCVRDRPVESDWTAMMATALQLMVAGRQPRCAERAIQGVLAAAPDSVRASRWGAFFAQQGLRIAEGREREAAAAIDSSVAAGNRGDVLLFPLYVMAGADLMARALEVQEIADRLYAESLEGIDPQFLWLFGAWYAHVGNRGQVERFAAVAAEMAAAVDDPQLDQYAEALAGHAALVGGDTAVAIQSFRSLRPVADPDALMWGYGEPYPVERLQLARLLLETGSPEEAYLAAQMFDHPGPVIFIAYLPESLRIRLQAADAMGRTDLAREARERLLRLERDDLLADFTSEQEEAR